MMSALPDNTYLAEEADAEFSLLAGILVLGGDYIDKVRRYVVPGDFGSREYNDVYRAVCALHDAGSPTLMVDIAEWLESNSRQSRCRWSGREAIGFMRAIIDNPLPVEALQPEPLAKRVHRLCQERRLKQLMLQTCAETGDSFQNGLSEIRRLMDDVEMRRPGRKVVPIWAGIEDWKVDQADVASGNVLATGWKGLDEQMGPIRHGELVVLAARSGVGKTFACAAIADAILLSTEASVLFIEQEMAASEVGGRIAAGVMEENPRHLKHDTLSIETIREFAPQLDRLVVCDRPVTISEIGALAREASAIAPCKAIIIDYLGLLIDTSGARTTYDRVTEQIKQLKVLARTLDVVIFCVCQLNRNAADGSVEPSMEMLRDAGTIEENADRVLLLWRESNSINIRAKIGKNRFGPVGGKTTLTFTTGMRLVEV